MVDIVLVSPPVSNFGQASPAIGVLTAYLNHRGWNAVQWDLGIEMFHCLYSAQRLASIRDALCDQHAERQLLDVADRAAQQIDQAKKQLQTPGITTDRSRMASALDVLREAAMVLNASSNEWELSDSKFLVPGAMNSFATLAEACVNPQRNPFIGYFKTRAIAKLQRLSPRVLGISITYLSQLIAGLTLARLVREQLPQTSIVLGGAYLTSTSYELERAPTSTLVADAIITHDGEHALDAWLDHVIKGEPHPAWSNIYLPQSGRYVRAGNMAGEVMELDEAPVPMITTTGLDLKEYLTPQYAHGLPLTRGCHWGRCNYCNISNQTSCSYRKRSPHLAVQDIRALIKESGSNWFDFAVDSFRPRDLWQLARDLIEQQVDIRWGAEVLLDGGFRDEVVRDLARSGCVCLRFGMESGCEQTLRAMNKATRPKIASRILGSCHSHGIRTAAMFIVGFPTETQRQLEQTFDFVVDNRDRIDFLTFHDYSLVVDSPMARDPGAFGLYVTQERAVFSPSIPFVNTNPGGMQQDQTKQILTPLRESLREYYPDLGQLWATGIGGWLTFPYCCENRLPAATLPARTACGQ